LYRTTAVPLERLSLEGMPISRSQPTETILVVDDEPEVLALVADHLQTKGYVLLLTGDPREALRLARTRTEPIHLLLTDVVMPLMNGRQLTEQLRAIRPEVKVLFMSAYSTEAVEDYGIRVAPGEPFLVKPFTMDDLANKVRAVLDYHSPFTRPKRN
jgi:DNA-binding response OmpR family regulator